MSMVVGGVMILGILWFSWWLIRATEEVGNLAGYYDNDQEQDDNDVE